MENQNSTQPKSNNNWNEGLVNTPYQKAKIPFCKYLETEKDLRSKIQKITTMISEQDPTFSTYNHFVEEKNSGLKNSRITLQELVVYYNTLSSILIKHRLNNPSEKQNK